MDAEHRSPGSPNKRQKSEHARRKEGVSPDTLASELGKTGTWNIRYAIRRAYLTAIEAVISDYAANAGSEIIDCGQAANESAYDLLAFLLSAEIERGKPKMPIERSRELREQRLAESQDARDRRSEAQQQVRSRTSAS
jgi:hypothetical protein